MVDIISLSRRAREENWIENISKKLEHEFGLTICVGIEIEFYLPNDSIKNSPFILKKERGNLQYEIALPPCSDPSLAVAVLESSMNLLTKWCPDINFHPKPFAEDYGNALHFHVNLLKDGDNYYDNAENLEAGARTLCHFLKPTFLVFAPEESHYTRFEGQMMAPTNVSYGGNNRTVAIRIPDARPSRLEHRAASPLADPYLALFTILHSLYLGLQNPATVRHYEKIYGNAHDAQYGLELLPRSVKEAEKVFDRSFYEGLTHQIL